MVINGPNLNMLGTREPGIYGRETLGEIEERMKTLASDHSVALEFFQSNHEGEIVDKVQACQVQADAIIINAGALSHYSISLHDALLAVNLPVIEVHLSNIYRREEFRHQSLISATAVGGVFGFGKDSYLLALKAAINLLHDDGEVHEQ
ncbi:MAG: type II 3-dehydroquinate dehydratase [Syntrophomonadaceae bacterium]|nr:type II 3-dehydroquinate dehydratase [Syntrophomonadaceae bacterium]